MKAKELSKVLKEVIKVLDEHPEAGISLLDNISTDEVERLSDLIIRFNKQRNYTYLSFLR